MFISRKKWNELQEKIDKLERRQEEIEVNQEIKTGIHDGMEFIGCFKFPRYKTFSLKQAVIMILDHLNLKISEQPEQKAEFKLVKKDRETQEEAPQ